MIFTLLINNNTKELKSLNIQYEYFKSRVYKLGVTKVGHGDIIDLLNSSEEFRDLHKKNG